MKDMLVRIAILIIVGTFIASCVEKHDIQGSTVEYTIDDTAFRGYLAYDRAKKERRPGILILHEWWGMNKQVQRRAEMLAEAGYTALVVDMYGEGRQASNSEEAAVLAKEVAGNPDVRQKRFIAALDLLRGNEHVDPEHIAAIGYSLGGNILLQMALDGADLGGVVSFSGGLHVKAPEKTGPVKTRILILQGEKDWYVTPQTIVQFKTDMKNAGIDYELIQYKDAEHGFTNPEADAFAEKYKGMHMKYDEEADKKSWADMQEFLKIVFRKL